MPIFLPFLVAIVLYAARNIISYTFILIATAGLTVVLANPYFVLDLPNFLDQTAWQFHHYRGGHEGHQTEPGVPQITHYLRSFVGQFGLGAYLASFIGAFYMFRLNWRAALILISYPLGMIAFMSFFRTNFTRNITPVYLIWPIFIYDRSTLLVSTYPTIPSYTCLFRVSGQPG